MQAKSQNDFNIIDVSHHQGSINWPKVKADSIDGTFIKATEGKTGVDERFPTNAKEANQAGLKLGYYHYARPENNSAEVEAAHFAKTVKGFIANFPHVLDVEGKAEGLGAAKLTEWCVAWLQKVEHLTDHPAMIYTGASFAKSYLGKELNKWPVWIAHYNVDRPMANSTWNEWAVFQYSDSGKVNGIEGYVDMNVMEKSFYDKYASKLSELEPSAPDDIKVIVNDKLVAYGRVIGGHVYLPVRKLGEALGYSVQWNARAATPYIDGKIIPSYKIINNVTYIGVRAAAELLHGDVSWDGEEKRVFFKPQSNLVI